MHQKKRKLKNYCLTDGNLALARVDPDPSLQDTHAPTLHLVPNIVQDVDTQTDTISAKGFLIATVTSMTFCALWVFFVFILYRIARTALSL